ncbi:MAG: 3-dehydroquinate synthase [Ginsengibacter sp.]
MTDIKMEKEIFQFSQTQVSVFFDASFKLIKDLTGEKNVVFITDQNLFNLHTDRFSGYQTIVIPAGESSKNQETVDRVINGLITSGADRNSFIIGVGGGVVTDLAGFVASIFMRGISFGFVPTSILAMVDAAVGGKNGIDVGKFKNMVGVIKHPEFLLYDYSFLKTLPDEEWRSGFAEIIKHACIKDKELFSYLQNKSLQDFQNDNKLIAELVKQNVLIKYKVVSGDENENGDRQLLNFGHTIGHAIEHDCALLHGYAISIGMMAAAIISEKIDGLKDDRIRQLKKLLEKYGLPTSSDFDKEKAWSTMLADKKKSGDHMNFIVLDEIGHASIKKIPLAQLQTYLMDLSFFSDSI